MRLISGLLKFSDSSDHGKLPTTRQITSFWSRYRSKMKLENAKTSSNSIPVDQLDEWVADSLDHSKELLGDDSIGIANDNVHTDSNNRSSGDSKNLHSKVFVLDGCFKEVGGDDVVNELIKSKGGKVRAKVSVRTNYVLQGSNPKKKPSGKKPNVEFIDLKIFQQLLKGNQVNDVGAPSPANKNTHDNASTDSSVTTANVTTAAAAMPVPEPHVPQRQPLSHVPKAQTVSASTSTKSTTLHGKVFVLDIVERHDEVKELIESEGGQVNKNMSKSTNYILQGNNPKKKNWHQAP